ncbi:DEAD/DEAH box helicase [bacterium]|nr:DEAD/DEAH box helicase [candidate division CSSED10-310 bacterium]
MYHKEQYTYHSTHDRRRGNTLDTAQGLQSRAPLQSVFSTLLPQLQRAVAEENYTVPTPIQEQAIPHLLEGRDLLGCAQTGTGKTAAFALPLLQYLSQNKINPSRGRPRALVLTPTRELAVQIDESIRTYGRYLHISHTVIFGGVGQDVQVRAVNRGVDIVVATPGRLIDLMRQGHVRLDKVEVFILDEADRMLDMGFIRDVRVIVADLPAERQTQFYSATLSDDAVALASNLVRNPVRITIDPDKPTVERIVQKVMFVEKNDKGTLLISLLRDRAMEKVLVFTRTKHGANKLAKKLLAAGVSSRVIHGNKTQSARTRALDEFKTGGIRVLVATDIAARGLDVEGISHVINYDLPEDPETYIHRVGRTARAGAGGDAISFCSSTERDYLRGIDFIIQTPIPHDTQQKLHSETARMATGAAARPPLKLQRGSRRSYAGTYGRLKR